VTRAPRRPALAGRAETAGRARRPPRRDMSVTGAAFKAPLDAETDKSRRRHPGRLPWTLSGEAWRGASW